MHFRNIEAVREYLKHQAQRSATAPQRAPNHARSDRLGLILAAGLMAGGALGAAAAGLLDSPLGIVLAVACVFAGIRILVLIGGRGNG